ncbi:TPA: hypothetical protein HA281_00990 [Candidatus Woesearchaeota archaeon]|nr:hypothetical protein [Candidatus Woesearchaeota archaeon]
MQKRGLADNAFAIALGAVVVIAIAIVGVSAVNTVRERACKAELADFQLFFSHLSEGMRPGTVNEESVSIPCGAKKLYIMDSSQLPEADWFADYPLVRDSVKGKATNTIFLMKDEQVLSSFEAPNVQVRYPRFLCLLPKSGKATLRVEGFGGSVSLDPVCSQPTCDEVLEPFDAGRITRVFRESDKADCPGCVDQEFSSIPEELGKAKTLYQNVKIYRKYSYCDGKMKIHLFFRPEDGVVARDFRFFEAIPKSCIENLDQVLDGMTRPDNGVSFVQPDPLLMWGFSTLDEDTEVEYGLDIILKDECAASIDGSALAREVEKKGEVLEPTALTPDEAKSNSDLQSGKVEAPPESQQQELRITSMPPTTVKLGDNYSYQVEASESGSLFTLTQAPAGMTITQSGLITWKPGKQGKERVSVRAQQQGGKAATQEFTVLVARNCQSHAERRCAAGDVWSFDSCGVREERVSNCWFGCRNGNCCLFC